MEKAFGLRNDRRNATMSTRETNLGNGLILNGSAARYANNHQHKFAIYRNATRNVESTASRYQIESIIVLHSRTLDAITPF